MHNKQVGAEKLESLASLYNRKSLMLFFPHSTAQNNRLKEINQI